MKTPLKKNFLVDTCALIDLGDALLDFERPRIIPAVHDELVKCAHMKTRGFDLRRRRFAKEGARAALKFYEQHSDYIIPEHEDPRIMDLARLTGKQIAYDIGRGIIFKESYVAGKELTDLGKRMGTEVVSRVNALQISIDERIAGHIIEIAMDAQRYVWDCVRYNHGRIQEPRFVADLLLLGTARRSPKFASSEVYVVSSDADIRHILWFSDLVEDRLVKYKHPSDLRQPV